MMRLKYLKFKVLHHDKNVIEIFCSRQMSTVILNEKRYLITILKIYIINIQSTGTLIKFNYNSFNIKLLLLFKRICLVLLAH